MKADLKPLSVLILFVFLALLALVPGEWIGIVEKFYLGSVISIVVLAGLFYKPIYKNVQEYRKTKAEIGYVPRSVKYDKYRREHWIDPKTGDVETTYDLAITNIGADELDQIVIPVFFEVYQSRKLKSPLTVEKILLNNHPLDNPTDLYATEHFEVSRGGRVEKGNFRVPLESIEGLKKGEKCLILIKSNCVGAFKNVKTHEWAAVDVFHPMKSAEVVVSIKGNWIIELIKESGTQNGIIVTDRLLKTVKLIDTAQAPKPKLNKNTVSWTIKKPKLSYRYTLHFKTQKAK